MSPVEELQDCNCSGPFFACVDVVKWENSYNPHADPQTGTETGKYLCMNLHTTCIHTRTYVCITCTYIYQLSTWLIQSRLCSLRAVTVTWVECGLIMAPEMCVAHTWHINPQKPQGVLENLNFLNLVFIMSMPTMLITVLGYCSLANCKLLTSLHEMENKVV